MNLTLKELSAIKTKAVELWKELLTRTKRYFHMGFEVVPEAAFPVDFASVLVSEPAAIT